MNGPLPLAVALVAEGALLALAVLHARGGRLAGITAWTTRTLVAGSVPVSAIAIYSAMWEIMTFDYPWTLPGQPLGTYAEPTALGVLMVVETGILFVAAAIVALFRPALAAAMFAAGAAGVFLGALRMRLFDRTFPHENLTQAAVFAALPALAIAALLLSRSETGRRLVRRKWR